MCWRCFAERCLKVFLALVSTGSQTVLPRSSTKHANSVNPKNQQRLAGYVGNPETDNKRASAKSAGRGKRWPLCNACEAKRSNIRIAVRTPINQNDCENRKQTSTLSWQASNIFPALPTLHSKRAAGRPVRGNHREGFHYCRNVEANSHQASDSSLWQKSPLAIEPRNREMAEGLEKN